VRYRIVLTPPARRALEHTLPEAVAAAAWEFIKGPLAERPRVVGKPLVGRLFGYWVARRGTYRIVFKVVDETVTVTVVRIGHRKDAYR
jgi:mRNA interferase RelE/StbE